MEHLSYSTQKKLDELPKKGVREKSRGSRALPYLSLCQIVTAISEHSAGPVFSIKPIVGIQTRPSMQRSTALNVLVNFLGP